MISELGGHSGSEAGEHHRAVVGSRRGGELPAAGGRPRPGSAPAHPSPRVRWRFATHDPGSAFLVFGEEPATFIAPTLPRPRVPPPTARVWNGKKPGPYTTHLDDNLPPLEHGDGRRIRRMRVG